jgi:hypothetical protein
MVSLRQQLNELIRRRGYISYWEIKSIVESNKLGQYYEMDTAKRRLRPSESPQVQEEKKDGVVVGYRWKGAPIVYRQYKVLGENGSVEKTINLI